VKGFGAGPFRFQEGKSLEEINRKSVIGAPGIFLDAIEEVYNQIEHAQPGRAASPAPAPKGALSGRKKEEYNELVKKGFVLDPAGTRGDKDSGCRAETTLLESRSVRRPAGKIE